MLFYLRLFVQPSVAQIPWNHNLLLIKKVKEQDYSLNPGRYMNVIIEEDGKAKADDWQKHKGANGEIRP